MAALRTDASAGRSERSMRNFAARAYDAVLGEPPESIVDLDRTFRETRETTDNIWHIAGDIRPTSWLIARASGLPKKPR